MKKLLKSRVFGLIPLLILIGYSVNLIWVVTNSAIGLQWQHMVGLVFVFLSTIAFFILPYKPAILLLGLTILLGLFGFLSLSPAIRIDFFGVNGVTLIRFQAIFLLWALIHFTLSGRFYLGIGTREFWQNIWTNEPLPPKPE